MFDLINSGSTTMVSSGSAFGTSTTVATSTTSRTIVVPVSSLWQRLSQVKNALLDTPKSERIANLCAAYKDRDDNVDEWAKYVDKTKELLCEAILANDNDALTPVMVQEIESRSQRIQDAFGQVIPA